MSGVLAWPRLNDEVRRLEPASQARLLGAFLILLALAVLLLLLVWLASRTTRRYLKTRDLSRDRRLADGAAPSGPTPSRGSVPRQDDWADKPLVEPERNEPDDSR